MTREERNRRRLALILLGELVVALLFVAAVWSDGLTTTAGKWAWTGVTALIFLVAAICTEWALDRFR